MHAWSEVEHDLIYKPLQGTLSKEELAILDELNGLVLAGEIALERCRLQEMNGSAAKMLFLTTSTSWLPIFTITSAAISARRISNCGWEILSCSSGFCPA